ncbi:protein TPRXL [Microbacterium suaedae]|uniref:protein TPRXL n=1 Tax=Microbacterium suaedae TaxID=2067813 RepID=UPI000DA1400A|nr:protein TPRXL [Microbacterium suaedae]
MTDGSGLTLREQLGGAAEPDFEIDLPAGWERREVGDDDRADLGAAMRRRFLEAQRPDLYAVVRAMVDDSYAAMQNEGALAYYAATTGDANTLWIPGSIIVSKRAATPEITLDQMVSHAIREFGAKPLFGDKRFVRFERDEIVKLGDTSIGLTTIEYLTPIPTTKRRRALQFTATVSRPLEAEADDEQVVATKQLYDACISTLRWVPPRAK